MVGRRAPTAPRPRRGQHFLRSSELAASIVAATGVSRRDLVVELGAGTGLLTRALADRAGRVRAVELDAGLCRSLRRTLARRPHVRVVEADLCSVGLPEEDYLVVGNVPFHHTARIVARLGEAPVPPSDAWLIVQREAALRFAGTPFARESLASLRLKPWWHIEVAARLGRECFRPPPAVHCALLWMARRPRPLVDARERALYLDFVSEAAVRCGERLSSGLGSLFSRAQLARLRDELRLPLEAPGRSLGFEQWLAVFRVFARHASPRARRRVRGAAARLPRQPARV